MGYFEVLLLIHIFGAIVGFGPTYAFAVLGPLSGKLGGPQALGILIGTLAISERLVKPVALVVQPVTGLLMIFETGRNQNFFSNEWLWIALLLYVVLLYTALFVQEPTIKKVIALAREGRAETPEFQALTKKMKTFGPVLTVVLTIIVFLMITKPGAPEGFF